MLTWSGSGTSGEPTARGVCGVLALAWAWCSRSVNVIHVVANQDCALLPAVRAHKSAGGKSAHPGCGLGESVALSKYTFHSRPQTNCEVFKWVPSLTALMAS